MKKSTKISFISAAIIYAAMGLSGCYAQKAIDLKSNSKTYVQTHGDSFETPMTFAPGKHVYGKYISYNYDEYSDLSGAPMSYEVPDGYKIISVVPNYRGYSSYYITYENIVTVKALPTLYIEGEGFKYGEHGTPVKENGLTKK